MTYLRLTIAASLLLATVTADARERLTPEQQLAKITAGRVAGKPVDCISQRSIQSSQIIDKTAIVYTMNNGTVYVNRPDGGAAFLNDDDILVTNTFGDQLCRIDIVRLVDRSSRFPSGSLGLSDFVPYPRPPKVKAGS